MAETAEGAIGAGADGDDQETAAWWERAAASDFFSSPQVTEAVASYLSGVRDRVRTVAAGLDVDEVVLVGSGGSLACLLTAQYLLESMSTVPVRVVPAIELAWRGPRSLSDRSLVVLNSWSGNNADVLGAAEHAVSRGARTVALVGKPESRVAQRCEQVLAYPGVAIYEVPILAVVDLVLALDLAAADPGSWEESVAALPSALEQANADGRRRAVEILDTYGDPELIYVLGAGPFSSLGLKLANVIMENCRIGAAFFDAAEFRHGAGEAFERFAPDVLLLAGSDPARDLTDRVAAFCHRHGASTAMIDAAPYGLPAPTLQPLVANVLSQWLIVELAHRRGIADLDERIFMGAGAFSDGQWP